MKRLDVLLFVILISIISSSGQNIPFMKHFGGLEDEELRSIKMLTGDLFITGGRTYSYDDLADADMMINIVSIDGTVVSSWTVWNN